MIGDVIVSQGRIKECVSRLAGEVGRAYAGNNDAVAVVLMMGAKWFADDLLKQVNRGFQVEYIRAKSYQGSESCGQVEIKRDIDREIVAKDVLLIDDIYDTGTTLKNVIEYFRQKGARSIKTCVLLEKENCSQQIWLNQELLLLMLV